VRVLSSSPRDMESVARLATSDSWPLVRASAIEALATSSRALPVLRAAVGDHSSHVRTAAVGALRARRDPASWSVIEPRLRDDDEWPSVIEQGVGFARDLCLRQAGDALTVVLRRGLRPDAWAPDVDLALEAFEALVAIGGPAGADAMRVASRPTAPGPLRAAARRARQSPPRCAAPRH